MKNVISFYIPGRIADLVVVQEVEPERVLLSTVCVLGRSNCPNYILKKRLKKRGGEERRGEERREERRGEKHAYVVVLEPTAHVENLAQRIGRG